MKKIILGLLFISLQAKKEPADISLSFINEPIVNVVNKLASLKNANIVLPPAKEDDTKKSPPSYGVPAKKEVNFYDIKVNLYRNEQVTLTEAWNLLTNFLNISGFSIFKRGDNYQIVPTDSAQREPLPLYVDVPASMLPNNDEQIRYVFYFRNINIYNKNSSAYKNLEAMISGIILGKEKSNAQSPNLGMPSTTPSSKNSFFELNSSSNNLIITSTSINIRALMTIIEELDKYGFKEVVEVKHLNNTNAKEIETLLTSLIKNVDEDPFYKFGGISPKANNEIFFSDNTKVVAIPRLNSVAVMGTRNSVGKIIKFIEEKLDLPVREGLSLIHVKPIEYLSSTDLIKPLKAILQNISTSSTGSSPGSFGQSSTTKSSSEYDEIQNVIITSEIEESAKKGTNSSTPNTPSWDQNYGNTDTSSSNISKGATPITGGNNIIVVARERQWNVIQKLINELDRPQLQVALQTLIVDIVLDDNDMLSTQLRNPTNQSSPSEFNWQALGLTGLIGTTPIIPANNLTVAGDLGANTAQSSATPNYVIPI